MTFTWFKIFNKTEWLAEGLVSRNITYIFEGLGAKEILITQGNETGVLVDDIFLILNFAGKNPYKISNWAIYEDENSDVWIGKLVT